MAFRFPCVVALVMIMVMLKCDAVQGKQDFVKTKNSVFSLEERNLLVLGKILHTLEKLTEPQTKCDKDDEINEKLLSLISTVDNTQKSVKIIADAAKKSSEDTSAKFETILTTIQNAQDNVKVYAKTTADAITKLQLADLEHIPTTSHTDVNVGTTTPIPTQPTINSDLCGSPYFLVGEECFRLSSNQKDWATAKLQCQTEGGNLAAPKNLDLLRQNLIESGDEDDYWIGAHDIDGTWKWITGDPVEDEWQTDEPSGRYGEDCLDFRVGSRWPALGDYYCQRTQRYICERPYTGTVSPTPGQGDCSDVGAIKVGQKCLIISEDELNWREAAVACTNNGGELVSLQNERDPQMIHDHIFINHHGRRFWLGGSDIDNEGQWVWMNGDPIENNFPWRYPQPDDFQGNEDCLEWGWGAHFNDAPCHVPFRYICELDASSTKAPTSKPQTETSMQDSVDCSTSNGHVRVGQKCLTFESVMLNWTDAVASCANNGGMLVTLAKRSDAESLDEYIQSNFDDQKFWLGGSDVDNEGTWVWVNGDQFQNFPWRYPQPNNSGGIEDCLEWGHRSHFNDHSCHDQRRYICEFDDLSTITETSETETDTTIQESLTEVTLDVSLSTNSQPTVENTTVQDSET